MDYSISKDYLREHTTKHRELRIKEGVRKIMNAIVRAAEKGKTDLVVNIVERESMMIHIMQERLEVDIAKDVYQQLQSQLGDIEHTMVDKLIVFKW